MNVSEAKRDRTSDAHEILARQGLRLPLVTLRRLKSAGIYCQPTVSIEHQHVGGCWVLRGVESGGAVAELGAYVSFVDEQGSRLPWLQRVDSIGVNGVHAIIVSPLLVRLQMVRIHRTYDLLITRHTLFQPDKGRRPKLESSILFFGRRGNLELDLWSKDAAFRGRVFPVFYSRSGETVESPKAFENGIMELASAASCVSCRHSHLLRPQPIAETGSTEAFSLSEACQRSPLENIL